VVRFRLVLQGPQDIRAIEHRDVLRLRRRDAANRPDQLDVIRLVRRMQRVHAHFLGHVIAFPVVAARARRNDVLPGIPTTPRDRPYVVARQELAAPQRRPMLAAVLAPIAVAREEERVGDLATEPAGDMNEADEANDGGRGEFATLRMEYSAGVALQNLRFTVDDQAQGPSYRQYSQRLE